MNVWMNKLARLEDEDEETGKHTDGEKKERKKFNQLKRVKNENRES